MIEPVPDDVLPWVAAQDAEIARLRAEVAALTARDGCITRAQAQHEASVAVRAAYAQGKAAGVREERARRE